MSHVPKRKKNSKALQPFVSPNPRAATSVATRIGARPDLNSGGEKNKNKQ